MAAAKNRCGMPFLKHSSNSSLAAFVRLDGAPTSTCYSSQPPHFGHTPWQQVMSQQSDTAQSYQQPNSYPSFSAPSMPAQYNYPPPEGQGQGQAKPPSAPSGSNMAHPNISLPPISSISQPHHPQSQQAPPMASAMPPNMGQYYGGQGQYPQPTSDPSAPVRYPIPPDGRQMSGGRHKKEIKRRTKTGCLTCRKRRIKVCKQPL